MNSRDFFGGAEKFLNSLLLLEVLFFALARFFSLHIAFIFWARCDNTTNSLISSIPTIARMSSFNSLLNRVHISASEVNCSRVYLLRFTYLRSYSLTDIFPYFNSRNSLFFTFKYNWLTYFFLNSVSKNFHVTWFRGVTKVRVIHHW